MLKQNSDVQEFGTRDKSRFHLPMNMKYGRKKGMRAREREKEKSVCAIVSTWRV